MEAEQTLIESQDLLTERKCPVCGSDASSLLFVQDGWPLVECHECRMVYISRPLSYQKQAGEYDWSETHVAEHARRRSAQPVRMKLGQVLRRMKRNRQRRMLHQLFRYRRSGKLLDVGCGEGQLLEMTQKHFQSTGVDISPQMTHLARIRVPDAEVVTGPVAEVGLEESSFDIATMISYLEHEWHPVDALAAVHRSLKPGGHLLIKVPHHGSLWRKLYGKTWSGYRFPDHCNQFTPATLQRLLRQTGFRCGEMSLLDQLPTSDNFWQVAQKEERPAVRGRHSWAR